MKQESIQLVEVPWIVIERDELKPVVDEGVTVVEQTFTPDGDEVTCSSLAREYARFSLREFVNETAAFEELDALYMNDAR